MAQSVTTLRINTTWVVCARFKQLSFNQSRKICFIVLGCQSQEIIFTGGEQKVIILFYKE